MKTILKFALSGALALSAVTAFAGQYPFPQNKKNPHGYTYPYADTEMIKAHYELWKKAWYQDSNGWVLAPEGTCSTVSEAIAYGMLITVYMDEEETFKKLYGVWKENGGNGGGMNWRVGCQSGSGSATDADEDAALALVMASKQWNNTQYLTDAKTIIGWIAENDVDGNNSLKPGNQWNPALNPSYVMPGHYRLFEAVTGDPKWSTIRTKAMKDLSACQDTKTGLVGDWCDWNSHKTIDAPGAAVSNAKGFYDDAARTPWRMAWGYYWYGDADAKKFNENVAKWLIPETHNANGVNSGYKWVDNTSSYAKDESAERNFVSSTFSGGLGLATSSVTDGEAYLESVYKVLANKKSCQTAEGCGGSVPGEKYYPATLNVLYLLLMTGNMPNLYDLTGFEPFTPQPKSNEVTGIDGVQQQKGDKTVGISGFWNWGAYHDKLGIGTEMSPDSGSSPLFLNNGMITAEAVMKVEAEPEWTEEAAAAGLLKYPSAGIAMSFLEDESAVDLTQFGVTSIRVTAKVSGPIRMALLYEGIPKEGGEPGTFLDPSNDYTVYDIDIKSLEEPDWFINEYPSIMVGNKLLNKARGLKFEVKDEAGNMASISIRSIEFLDASGNVVDPSKITGFVVPDGIKAIAAPSMAKISVAGMNIAVNGVKAGSEIAVFSLQGQKVVSTKASFGNASVTVPTKGVYLVRVGGKVSKVNVK